VAKRKTKDLEIRLKAATAALALLVVVAKLVEMVVLMAHH